MALRDAPCPVEVVLNGVAPGPARIRYGERPPRQSPLIGMVARLAPEKRHDVFLATAALVLAERPDVRMLLAGDGPCRSRVQDGIRALGLALLQSHRTCMVTPRKHCPR